MKSSRSFIFILVAFVLAIALTSYAAGAEAAKRRIAITDINKVDGDFPFQGEYAGFVTRDNVEKYVGLQVIAHGAGDFKARLLEGGLPGAGWDRENQTDFDGKRNGPLLALNADGYQIAIEDGLGTVKDSSGADLGVLAKQSRVSPSMGLAPPSNATILFDGTSTDQFEEGAKISEEGLLQEGVLTKLLVGDFRLHLEFRTPYMPNSLGQQRGNSGVYIQRRYEVQVLDSFGLEGIENECGGLYRQKRPDVNMALPPLTWQTYDIYFAAARWDDQGNRVANAHITVLHNGIAIHNNHPIASKTGAGQKEAPTKMPIQLQNHSDPVRYRNVWIVTDHGQSAPIEN